MRFRPVAAVTLAGAVARAAAAPHRAPAPLALGLGVVLNHLGLPVHPLGAVVLGPLAGIVMLYPAL